MIDFSDDIPEDEASTENETVIPKFQQAGEHPPLQDSPEEVTDDLHPSREEPSTTDCLTEIEQMSEPEPILEPDPEPTQPEPQHYTPHLTNNCWYTH